MLAKPDTNGRKNPYCLSVNITVTVNGAILGHIDF